MGISSSLNAGVQGLAVNATRLATISDNIANAGTIGYKRAETDFSSMVLSESPSRYTAGGVRAVARRDVSANGLLLATNNATDIALDGRGFLPVLKTADPAAGVGAGNFRISTTGSFRPDAAGYLRNSTGDYLLGWSLNPDGTFPASPARDSVSGLEAVRISGREFTVEPTTRIDVAANVPADATEAGGTGDPYEVPVTYIDNLGAQETLTLRMTPQVPATGRSNTWTVDVVDGASGTPTTVASYEVEFDTSQANGGSILNVTTLSGGAYDPATGVAQIAVAGGTIDLDIGTPGSGVGLTQFAGPFAPVSVTGNGAAAGSLSGVEIGEDGVVMALFDNGARQPLYRVPVVDVPNPDGLRAVSGQGFEITGASGGFYLWDAGTGPVGTTVGFALEQSTTDIAEELTHLIETQRAYSSNAKIIQTVDEMLQETTNLKR
ncbi:flagellar hook protein FlgE [Futiania mangrovi]|uniref:Flagellar hook protein FlgE n=1 Tax=Futiania mangrovi TaxID=2959716 RepID=A0A9J6PC40_9PROT|nr:flagellar hook-basal body complex protein [Futiania mangrovii]MCP1336845.1 flagellar hook-basal body complex protein [Futiania mangrovii]